MKNIFIGGVAKSGKSTLAVKLKEKGEYNHIPVDYFASSFKHNFSDVGITSNVIIDRNSSKKLALFLSRVIDIISCHDELFIIDSAHIMPTDIIKYLDRDKWDIYYLGYSKITKEEKFKIVREHESENGWTCKRSDEELLDTFDKLINISREIEIECKLNNIKYIDTSNGFSCFDNL